MAEVTGSRLLGQPAALRLWTGAARASLPDTRDHQLLRALTLLAAAVLFLQASTCRSVPPGVQGCFGACSAVGSSVWTPTLLEVWSVIY